RRHQVLRGGRAPLRVLLRVPDGPAVPGPGVLGAPQAPAFPAAAPVPAPVLAPAPAAAVAQELAATGAGRPGAAAALASALILGGAILYRRSHSA
ncbi:hypothetical protein AB0F20_31215, partial [Streptomyces goshikiensis]